MKDSKKLFRKLGFVGAALCAACCLLPIAGVMFGMGALTFLSSFIEWAGIVAMIVAVVFFTIYFFRSKKAPACDVDCACKDDTEAKISKQ